MSNLVIPDHVQDFIANICKKFDIEEDEMKVRIPVEPGENWLAQILEVNVFGKSPNGQPHKISLIVKLAPTLDLYRNFFPILESYQREAYTYNTILPEFEKIQRDHNVKNLFLPFAHCYQTYMGKFKETIVLENMAERGYQSINQKVPVDFLHASLIMKMFGKFHALSFAMRLHKPEVFKKIGMNTRESFVNSCFRKHYVQMVTNLGKQILSRLDEVNPDFLQFLENPDFIMDKIIFPEIAGEHAVVCYGDAQTRNMLFRYEEKSNDPIDACMLDWQLVRFGHPCLDVGFFVWTSIDRKLRHRHYNDLIELYHSSFSSFLRELGGDPDVCFPMATFKEHLKKFSVFGLFASVWVVLTNVSEEVPNVYAADTADKIVSMLTTVTCDAYFVRMKEILEDFVEYGYYMVDC